MKQLDLNQALQLLISLRAISDKVLDINTPFLAISTIKKTGVDDTGDIATMSVDIAVYPALLDSDILEDRHQHYRVDITMSITPVQCQDSH